MLIAGYLKTSLIEWPGNISAVIFTPGCNFRCPFCHNADLVDPQIKKIKTIEEGVILTDLKSRKKWLDSVVVTGGEPTLRPDLISFFKKIRMLGLKTMLETNGSQPQVISRLLKSKLLDFIAMDYKTTFAAYEKVAGVKAGPEVVKSVKLILSSGLPFEFRTTIVPSIHNQKLLNLMAEDLKVLVGEREVAKLKNFWLLQSFQPKNCLDKEFNKIKPFNELRMKQFLPEIKLRFDKVRLRE